MDGVDGERGAQSARERWRFALALAVALRSCEPSSLEPADALVESLIEASGDVFFVYALTLALLGRSDVEFALRSLAACSSALVERLGAYVRRRRRHIGARSRCLGV